MDLFERPVVSSQSHPTKVRHAAKNFGYRPNLDAYSGKSAGNRSFSTNPKTASTLTQTMSPSPAIFDRRQLTRQLGLLAVLAILYLGGIWLRQEQASPNQQEAIPLLELLASRPLVITRHGQCRMDCREISLTEIRQALTDGHLNTEKSEPDNQPCPTWAV